MTKEKNKIKRGVGAKSHRFGFGFGFGVRDNKKRKEKSRRGAGPLPPALKLRRFRRIRRQAESMSSGPFWVHIAFLGTWTWCGSSASSWGFGIRALLGFSGALD
jgi:hypothetical protein